MIQLQWTKKGIFTSAMEIVDLTGNVVGTMSRRSSFKHRTLARYHDLSLEFDYDGGFRGNINVFDAGGMKIGQYRPTLWSTAGKIHGGDDGSVYDFRKDGKVYEYKYKLQRDARDLVLYEITSQKMSQSTGTIDVLDADVTPRLILVGLYLTAYE